MENVDTRQARRQRFTALAEVEADACTGVGGVDDDTAADEEAPGAKRERSLEASVKAVKGLCNVLDRRVRGSCVSHAAFFFRCPCKISP